MTKRDMEWILAVLKGECRQAEANADWYGILGFLELHRVAGYFAGCAERAGLRLPQAVEKRLNAVRRSQRARNQVMGLWLEDIGAELDFERIPYVFLKGSVLSHANLALRDVDARQFVNLPHTMLHYQSARANAFYAPGERASNDIDLLIRPCDITRVGNIFKSMGFVQGQWSDRREAIDAFPREEIVKRRMNRGETAPFLRKLDQPSLPYLEVDINFSVDFLPVGKQNILDDMLGSAVRYSGKLKNGIVGMDVEYFLLHLLLHRFKETVLLSMVGRGKHLELYKDLDILLLLSCSLWNRERFVRIVGETGTIAEVADGLHELNEVFRLPQVAALLKRLGADPKEKTVEDPATGRRWRWKGKPADRLLRYDRGVTLEEIGT